MIFPKSLLAARRVGVATLLLPLVPALFGCSDEGSTDTESGALGQEESAVVGGSDTWDRPEVAQLQILGGFNGAEGGWCTATMISPIAFVTAAHCIDYATSGGNGALIHMRTGPNSNQARDTDVLSIYSLGNAPGTGDLAIGFLRVANPDGWDWTSGLHYGAFPSGLWTKIGYGCNSRSGGSPGIGGGVKRYREGSGSGTAWNCWGDSGGPLLAGGLFAFGGVAMVASGFNSNGTDNDAWVDPVWVEGMHRELSTPARGRGYEFGVDRPGFDYTSFSTSDAPPCRNACLADPHCQAFTVTFDSRGQTCFLKSAAASADPIPVDILSGVSEGYGSFDLPNGDLFVRDEPSVESCEGYCARTSTCRAFSYTNVGKCWIKDRANALRASTTVQSGTRRDLEVGIDRPGMDLRSGFASSSAAACSRSCVADKRCDAFSFTAGTCWLKAGIPGPVANAAATSGLRRGIEYNSRRNGAVYKDFDLGNEPMRRRLRVRRLVGSAPVRQAQRQALLQADEHRRQSQRDRGSDLGPRRHGLLLSHSGGAQPKQLRSARTPAEQAGAGQALQGRRPRSRSTPRCLPPLQAGRLRLTRSGKGWSPIRSNTRWGMGSSDSGTTPQTTPT